MNTLNIKGANFKAVESFTPFELRNSGRANTAAQMEKSGIVQFHTVTKFSGSTIYQVAEYKSGNFGQVVRVA